MYCNFLTPLVVPKIKFSLGQSAAAVMHMVTASDMSPSVITVYDLSTLHCEAYTGFWWGNLRETDHLGDPGVDGRIILRSIFRTWDVGV